MAKERTAHACPRFERQPRCELREHLLFYDSPANYIDTKRSKTRFRKYTSKFRANDAAVLSPCKLVSYSRANARHNATVHSKRLTQPVSPVPPPHRHRTLRVWSRSVVHGKVHYAPFVRASMRQSRNQMLAYSPRVRAMTLRRAPLAQAKETISRSPRLGNAASRRIHLYLHRRKFYERVARCLKINQTRAAYK